MKISKRTAQIITVLTVVLGILFATSMVFAADSYVIPTADRKSTRLNSVTT